MDLKTLIMDFLEYLEVEKNVSRLTIRNYAHYLNRFLGFITGQIPSSEAGGTEKKLKKITPQDINPDVIHEYRLFLSRYIDEHGISLKRVTQNYHLIALRSFFKYLLKKDIDVMAPEKIDLPKL